MSKGKGLGQLQHSFNNLSLETATMPPNVKDILNRRGDAIVNSIRIGRTPVQSAIQGILKTLSTVPYDNLFHLFMVFKTKITATESVSDCILASQRYVGKDRN